MKDEFIAAARSFVNTPFVHQGRSPGVGLDCAGLIVCAAAAVGIYIQDRANYSRLPYAGELESAIEAQENIWRVLKGEAGDVALMRFGRSPQHLGIIANDTIIHAFQPSGKVCEHRIDDAWRRRIVRAYRLGGLHVG